MIRLTIMEEKNKDIMIRLVRIYLDIFIAYKLENITVFKYFCSRQSLYILLLILIHS